MNTWILVLAIYAIVQNFGCAAIQFWLLRRQESWPRWLGAVPFIWAFVMCGLFILAVIAPPAVKNFLREWLYFPMSVEMVWNVLMLQALFPVMLLTLLVVRFRRLRLRPQPMTSAGMSRRRFLYLVGLGAAPATAIGMGVHGSLTAEDLRRRDFTIAVPNLARELEGFTIAHVSDLHSGIFVGPTRLQKIADATNALNAQMIVITGDIINRDMNEFPAALAALQQLKAPHGIYLCEGNHDIIPGYRAVADACDRHGLPMLFNETVLLPFGAGRLVLGGLEWRAVQAMDTHPGMVGELFPARRPGDVRVLLAHHPDLFDVAQEADIVLSGHTHGGQIMFGDQVGLGRIRFKYCSGRFERGTTTMIVSNGSGDWFPCRIGAPAEVGLITLTRG